jgi:hypothetical protein
VRRRAALLSFVLASLAASAAHANGRYPESNQITFSETDPDLMLVRVTFGLLVSRDRGKTFHWVCEQSIGFTGVEDPMYAVTPTNTIVGTTYQGVTISRDRACGFDYAGGELKDQVFIDLSANPNDLKNIVVFASSYDTQDDAGNIIFKSRVWETKDEAQSFVALPGVFDGKLLGYTIDLAASDPQRIYVTAVRDSLGKPEGILLTSKDHGATYEELTIPLVNGEKSLFIAAIDRRDADKVYLRTGAGGPDMPSRLLLREGGPDGGSPTIRALYTGAGPLAGFALSRDGQRVFVGGPKDGLRVASTSDHVFEQRSTIEIQCLAESNDGLWACSSERSGFVAGLSNDEGRTFEARLHFCENIPGALDCPEGTRTRTECAPLWEAQRRLLCGVDAGVDAGGPPLPPPKDSNCGVHTFPVAPSGALAAATAVIVAAARRLRRRR